MMKKQKTEFGLEKLTDHDLVERFNRQVGLNAWVSARGRFFHELRQEIKNRGWVYSESFMTKDSLSLKYQIQVDDGKVFQIGIEDKSISAGRDLSLKSVETKYLNQEELVRECLQRGLITGYSTEITPHDTFHSIDGELQNKQLREYLEELTLDEEGLISLDTDNIQVFLSFTPEEGIKSFMLENRSNTFGFFDRWDEDGPRAIAAATRIFRTYAINHPAFNENSGFNKEDSWQLSIRIDEGCPQAELRLNGRTLEEGQGQGSTLVTCCLNEILPNFDHEIWHLVLEFEMINGEVEVIEHEIVSKVPSAYHVGFFPDPDEETPFQLSDLY